MTDPLKNIILRIFTAIVVATLIVVILKPFIVIASGLAVCGSCDAGTSILLTVLVFFGAIGISMYRLMGIFYGSGDV